MPATTQSIERLLRQRDTLLGFVEAIAAELELRPLLTHIVQYACQLLGADRGSIGLVDQAGNLVRTEATYHMPPSELGNEMPLGVGLAGVVLRMQQPVILDRYGDVELPAQAEHHDDAVIGVPILWQDRMIGFFGIGNSPAPEGKPARHFKAADVEALQVFARHAAIAIVNARRYAEGQRRSERFELIARIGRVITAAPCVDDLLQNAAEAIHEALGFPNVVIAVADETVPGRLLIRAASGASRELLATPDIDAVAALLPEGVVMRPVDGSTDPGAAREFVVPAGVGLLGAAALERRTIVCNDIAADPRYMPLPGMQQMQADMALPLLLGDQLLGVINLESAAVLTEEDRIGMQIVADQLAIAMENTRLYEHSTRLAALQERERIARDLHDSVAQQLFGLTMIAESIAPAWRRDRDEGERRA
ncbi:MAG: GAF domain-containing protein, partial [Longimicrobiales bacterium]